jgi:hypothetical protein
MAGPARRMGKRFGSTPASDRSENDGRRSEGLRAHHGDDVCSSDALATTVRKRQCRVVIPPAQ